jgi:hypothetical protein
VGRRPSARLAAILVALAAILIGTAAAAAPDRFHRGAAGLGDPIFPKAGNGGYEVDHYALGTTDEFVALAEARSGRSLNGFFDRWLYRRGRP